MPSIGNDLARIRKHQNLTIEDIQEATKIPVHILESIEDNSIFTDIEENTTYIRSYVRSYAKALKIEDEQIIRSLDQVETGHYDGLLGKGLRGQPRRPTFSYDPGKAGEDATAGAEKENELESGTGTDENELEEVRERKSKEEAKEESDEEKTAGKSNEAGKRQPAESGTQEQEEPEAVSDRMPPPPSVGSVDWADMGRKFTPLQTKSRIWIGIVILVVIAAAVLFYILYQNNGISGNTGPDEPVDNTSQAITPDSLQLNLTESENETQQAAENTVPSSQGTELETLPDTLHLVIYAAYGKLEPVRVFTDVMDNLNPYWIEQGEAYQFEFVNTLRIRGQYSRMVLMLNGHPVENFQNQFYNNNTRMLEINREAFENDPKWLRAPPDSLGLGVPPPDSIQQRPIFN